MSRDNAIILDILKAARPAIEFLGDAGQDNFNRDSKTQSAILHQLLLIGEAVKRLSEDFRIRHRLVPWKKIAGMRDVLMYQYINTMMLTSMRYGERCGMNCPDSSRSSILW